MSTHLTSRRICHNKFGPHDHKFHALWNELRHEWEALSAKGFTGEGFLGSGRALGGQRVPNDELRRRARAAAQDRQTRQEKERRDRGRRLGGPAARPLPGSSNAPSFPGGRRIEVQGGGLRDAPIADATIRRTSSVTDGCGTGTAAAARAAEDALLNGFRTKADMDEADQAAIQAAMYELMQMEEIDLINERGRDRDRDRARQEMQRPERELTHRPAAAASGRTTPPREERGGSHGLQWDPVNGLQPADRASPPRRPPSAPPARRPSNPPPSVMTSAVAAPPPPVTLDRFGRPISRIVLEAERQQQQTQQDPRRDRRGRAFGSLSSSSRAASQPPPPTRTASQPPTQQQQQQQPQASRASPWSCGICTLINEPSTSRCAACETPRPAPPAAQAVGGAPDRRSVAAPVAGNARQRQQQQRRTPLSGSSGRGGGGNRLVKERRPESMAAVGRHALGWACVACGTFMAHEWWMCSSCGEMKISS